MSASRSFPLRVASWVLLAPVHLWRSTAPLRQPRCRFYPSCSTYAVGAVRAHGPLRGSALAAGRLLRCHPWNPGGIDHVPPARAGRSPATTASGRIARVPSETPSGTPSGASSGARDA